MIIFWWTNANNVVAMEMDTNTFYNLQAADANASRWRWIPRDFNSMPADRALSDTIELVIRLPIEPKDRLTITRDCRKNSC